MCQKAPGPRCAGHLRKAIDKNTQEMTTLMASGDVDTDSQKIVQLQDLSTQGKILRFQYDGTPTGQKELSTVLSKAVKAEDTHMQLAIIAHQQRALASYEGKKKLAKKRRIQAEEKKKGAYAASLQGAKERKINNVLTETYGEASSRLVDVIDEKLDKPYNSYEAAFDKVEKALWIQHPGGETANLTTQKILIALDRAGDIPGDGPRPEVIRYFARKEYEQKYESDVRASGASERELESDKSKYTVNILRDEEEQHRLINRVGQEIRRKAEQGDITKGSKSPRVHRTAYVNPNVKIPGSSQVRSDARITSGAKIGERVIIGAGSMIDDDVVVGEGTTVGDDTAVYDGAKIGTDTKVGTRVTIGFNAYVGSRVTIANGVNVPSASYVPDDSTVEKGNIHEFAPPR